MQRIMTSTALVFAGALLRSGCTGGGGGSPPSAAPCETVKSEVRDISNGAQNALASGDDPNEIQSSLEDYSVRVTDLGETTSDAVSTELEALSGPLADPAGVAGRLPT